MRQSQQLLQQYSYYFSLGSIVDTIIELRIKDCFKQHQKYLVTNNPRLNLGEVYSYTPPRRKWLKPSLYLRRKLNITQQTRWSLLNTIKKYWHSNEQWLVRLKELVHKIQIKAFETYEINKPSISFLPKDNGFWRPLTLYNLEDHIFICLLAKYLTDTTDTLFPTRAIAFRSKNFQQMTGIKSYHQLVENIIEYKKDKDIYVSECDIKSFYDVVNHDLVKELAQQYPLDGRALKILDNYLSSYEFKDVYESAFQQEKPIKFPIEEINKIYKEPTRIGIPQGGAISCWISNLVLSEADKNVTKDIKPSDLYYRYCDDIILMSTNKKRGSKLFNSYIKSLRELKLPYHKPLNVPYSKEWYSVKTKVNYRWSSIYPWISFLGYQIKYNGSIRIRRKSIEKEKTYHVNLIDDVIKQLKHIKLSRRQIYQYMVKIRATLYKRITGKSCDDSRKPKTYCWSNGFRLLRDHNYDKTQLKELDRSLEQEFRRLKGFFEVKYTKLKFHYEGSYLSSIENNGE